MGAEDLAYQAKGTVSVEEGSVKVRGHGTQFGTEAGGLRLSLHLCVGGGGQLARG